MLEQRLFDADVPMRLTLSGQFSQIQPTLLWVFAPSQRGAMIGTLAVHQVKAAM